MVLVGYIVAPPTSGSFWAWALRDVMAKAATARVARNVFFIVVILCDSWFLEAHSLQGVLISIYVHLRGLDLVHLHAARKSWCRTYSRRARLREHNRSAKDVDAVKADCY